MVSSASLFLIVFLVVNPGTETLHEALQSPSRFTCAVVSCVSWLVSKIRLCFGFWSEPFERDSLDNMVDGHPLDTFQVKFWTEKRCILAEYCEYFVFYGQKLSPHRLFMHFPGEKRKRQANTKVFGLGTITATCWLRYVQILYKYESMSLLNLLYYVYIPSNNTILQVLASGNGWSL